MWLTVSCFLVLACVHCPLVGGGCGCVWGWAFVMDTLSGSRSIPVGRDAPSPSSFSSFCWGCGGGVWLAVGSACCVGLVVWWVVCDLYSGCEHLVCFVVLFSFIEHSAH